MTTFLLLLEASLEIIDRQSVTNYMYMRFTFILMKSIQNDSLSAWLVSFGIVYLCTGKWLLRITYQWPVTWRWKNITHHLNSLNSFAIVSLKKARVENCFVHRLIPPWFFETFWYVLVSYNWLIRFYFCTESSGWRKSNLLTLKTCTFSWRRGPYHVLRNFGSERKDIDNIFNWNCIERF